jgi:hypothetical protein
VQWLVVAGRLPWCGFTAAIRRRRLKAARITEFEVDVSNATMGCSVLSADCAVRKGTMFFPFAQNPDFSVSANTLNARQASLTPFCLNRIVDLAET